MGDPWAGVDGAGFHGLDNFPEVPRAGIPARQQGELHSMEVRVMEGDVIHYDSNEDDPASLGNILEAAHHRVRVTGYVEDRGRELTFERIGEPLWRIVAAEDRVFDTEMIAAEAKAFRVEVQNAQAGSSQLRELDHTEADGAAADDKDGLTRGQSGALYGVGADSEGLDQGQLVSRQRLGPVELTCRNRDDLPHAAIYMDSEHLQAGAAIGTIGPAGDAVSAVEVRLDRAQLASLQLTGASAWIDNLDAQLVSEDPGIFKKRLAPTIGVEVCSADSDAPDLYQHVISSRLDWRFRLGHQQLAGFFKHDRLHAGILPVRTRVDQPVSGGLSAGGLHCGWTTSAGE